VNDRWLKRDGSRWGSAEKRRVARLFRHHVRTFRNPMGRIHREACWFCRETARLDRLNGTCNGPREEHLPLAPAHHIDYDRPFVVVWACDKHHRMLDHCSLTLPLRAIHDYTSLIEAPGIAQPGRRREARRTGTDGEEVPF
jgi:hypothetical protein